MKHVLTRDGFCMRSFAKEFLNIYQLTLKSMFRINIAITFVSAVLFATLLGCGPGQPPLYPVHGKVTLEGTPLTEGIVTFEDAAAGIAESAEISSDGSYQTELLNGTYKVSLMPVFVEQKAEDGTMEEVLKNPENFPSKYQKPDTSGLSISVSEDTGYDINMTKK